MQFQTLFLYYNFFTLTLMVLIYCSQLDQSEYITSLIWHSMLSPRNMPPEFLCMSYTSGWACDVGCVVSFFFRADGVLTAVTTCQPVLMAVLQLALIHGSYTRPVLMICPIKISTWQGIHRREANKINHRPIQRLTPRLTSGWKGVFGSPSGGKLSQVPVKWRIVYFWQIPGLD